MKYIAVAAVAIAILGSAYMAMSSASTYMKVQATQSCIKAGSVQTRITQGDQVQSYNQPDGAWYETCMRDMGYRGSKK